MRQAPFEIPRIEPMVEATGRNRDRGAALTRLLEDRIAILDGAMATQILSLGLGERDYRGVQFEAHDCPLMGNHDLLSITQPDLIGPIHRAYLEAGADIITTNTFRANGVSMDGYRLSDRVFEINFAAARLAANVRDSMEQTAPDWPRFVAGAVSAPTPESKAYTEQVRGLLDGGIDFLLLETVFDAHNALAALNAFEECFRNRDRDVPVVVSATISARGRLLSGETLERFWSLISAHRLLGVGINCAAGPRQMEPYVKRLAEIASPYIICYPNAGLPDSQGHYGESPETIASVMAAFADRGWLNIAGGCCGTGPEHVRRIGETLSRKAPRQRPHALG